VLSPITGFTVPILPMLYLASTNIDFFWQSIFWAASFGPAWHWDFKTMCSIRSGRKTAQKPLRYTAGSMP
jgi:hypothetical protein